MIRHVTPPPAERTPSPTPPPQQARNEHTVGERKRERGKIAPPLSRIDLRAPDTGVRLRVLEVLTVLVPAVCAGIYETARHSLLANSLPNGVGTALAVVIVVTLSFAFARASFGIIHRMAARLRERNRRLEALSRDARRVATLEERERLAREIHDGVAQVIATLLVRVDTIEGLVTRGRLVEAAAELRDLRASGDRANVEVREAIAGLRANPSPGADGLAEALRRYVEEFGARTGVDASFHVEDTSRARSASSDLTPGHELHLMRVAIEALTNVRKHAQARRVEVTLGSPDATGGLPGGRGWTLVVADDGVGFGTRSSGDDGPVTGRRHFGLAMVRERVEALGGTCDIRSEPAGGTRVTVVVPARGPERDGDDDPADDAREVDR